MRLRHIEVFHEVYRHGSITAAAHVLHISQPSVSKALMHAESQLGFLLFKRSATRLIPTDEAHALFREIAPLYERIESVRSVARNLRTGAGGHIRIALVPALALDVVPAAIVTFRASHPNVTFGVQVLHFDEAAKALLTRKADIAVMYDPVEHPLLTTFRVGTGEIMALCRPEEFDGHEGRLPIRKLVGRPYIGSSDTGPLSDILNALLHRDNLQLDEVVTVDVYYAAVESIRSGGGVALVDEFTARARLAGDLAAYPLDPELRFGVYCVHMADRPLSLVARAFTALLKARLRAVRTVKPHSLTA